MIQKIIIVIFLVGISRPTFAQINSQANLCNKWQWLDYAQDSIYGISGCKTKQVYLEKKSLKQKVIVAVIDCGVEVEHSYINKFIWTNNKEIANNKVDDDRNGFVDDINGWNFVGNTKASCDENIRDYIFLKSKFENSKDSLTLKKHPDYNRWIYVTQKKNELYLEFKEAISFLEEFKNDYLQLKAYYKENYNFDTVNYKTIINFPVSEGQDTLLYKNYQKRLQFLTNNPDSLIFSLDAKISEFTAKIKELDDEKKYTDTLILYSNPYYYFEQENIYPNNFKQKRYGNGNIISIYDHGTACTGIISDFNYLNSSSNILIMNIKIFVNPFNEQNDKDLQNAVHYAVDNGAKIINMSFSNYTCLNRKLIDEAFIYAQNKGVIIVQSAGNQSIDIDKPLRYPTAELSNGKRVDNVIRVGASSRSINQLACDFSNYGQKQVDVFAPGDFLQIPTINDKFIQDGNGTSFATPIVSGLAAMLWSYYPQLNYKQIVYCIKKSSEQLNLETLLPGSLEKVKFSTLSKTGGIVNMFRAFNIAEKISEQK